MKISVAAVAIKDKKLFIAQRPPGGDMGGKWEFPGGKAEDGEGPREALKREFREEFAADISVGDFIGEAEFLHKGDRRILKAFRTGIDTAAITLKEHSAWRWADIEELEEGRFTPSDLKLLPFIVPLINEAPGARS